MSEMEKGKYLRLGKRIAWAEDPEQRRFARQLVLEGNGPKKIAAALNRRFGLSVNGNSLGGFIFEHKGDKDGPAFFLELLSDGEEATARTTKKATAPTREVRVRENSDRKPSSPARDVPKAEAPEVAAPLEPKDTAFDYEEYLRMSLGEERHVPGNGPLRTRLTPKSSDVKRKE